VSDAHIRSEIAAHHDVVAGRKCSHQPVVPDSEDGRGSWAHRNQYDDLSSRLSTITYGRCRTTPTDDRIVCPGSRIDTGVPVALEESQTALASAEIGLSTRVEAPFHIGTSIRYPNILRPSRLRVYYKFCTRAVGSNRRQ
jgi:hypothetical protein